MAKLQRATGTTSEILQVFIQDSSSTTGAGLTGLLFNTASLTAYYHRDSDTTATVITLVTMTVGTFTSSGFKEIDATNMPGWYQLCVPNAALAAGARSVAIHLKGATNMAPLPLEIELTAVNNQSTGFGLVNASANVAQINSVSTASVTTVAAVQGTTIAPTFTAALMKVDVTDWNATAVAAPATAGIPDVNIKNMNNVSAAAITTVKAVQGLAVDGVIPTATNLTNAPTNGDFTATMKTSIGTAVAASAVASVTGAVGSVGAGGIAAASFAANAIDSSALATSAVSEIWANACTEPTAAVAKAPTVIAAISWLLTLARNKITQTSTTQTLLADDDATPIATVAVSDDGVTFTRGKAA